MSRCSARVSTLSIRMRAKCAPVARVSRSRNTSLLAEQLARSAHVAGHEHSSRGAHIRRKTAEHVADFGGPFGRKCQVALGPLRAIRLNAPFDNVAGMFEVGNESEDLRQSTIVLGVE